MSEYKIESKAGVVFGVYKGETPEEAFTAMVAEAGGPAVDCDGCPVEGAPDDWIITKVEMTMSTEQFAEIEAAIAAARAALPEGSHTARLIDANAAWGDIAQAARMEGLDDLADDLADAEAAWWEEEGAAS